MESPLFLSVVVPAYNEQENFSKGSLERLYEYLERRKEPFEVLLCDDGSRDETLKLLSAFASDKEQVKVLTLPHRGKGPTVKDGMLAAKGTIRLFTDFDQSTPIQEVEKLLPYFREGYEVVIGSREVKGALREKEPWYRHLMGRVFNACVQLLAVPGIQDTQCGFKAFTDKAAIDLFPRLKATVAAKKDSFTGAFDAELLFIATKRGYTIAEVPVTWHHEKTQRVSPIKDSVRMLFQLIHLRLMALTRQYET